VFIDAFLQNTNLMLGALLERRFSTQHIVQYWPKVTHGPAHFLRARSSRHLQYMNGRHTRNKRVRSACQMQLWRANVTQMLCECRASYARHSSSKCDVKHARITRVVPDARSALHSMGYFWSVLYVSNPWRFSRKPWKVSDNCETSLKGFRENP
jgi:hypothetical protein